MLKRRTAKVLMHAFMIFFCVMALIPLYIMLVGSMKNPDDLAANSYGLPNPWTLNNYLRLWGYNSGIIVRTYVNSIFITVAHTLLVLGFSALAAFAFSKYRFKGRVVIFTFLLATMMVPFELSITPLYIMFSRIKWLNTYQIQIIPFTANVFAMFMLRQYMNSISDSLLEAATIDGAGHMRTFFSVMLPVCKPVLGAVAVLVALAKFNDYLWPKAVVSKQEFSPIMTILPTLNEKAEVWNVPRELILTGCTIVIIPLVLLFIGLQDVFMSSVTVGAIKE
jgi:ABC-type glycerol-3-phosphate transport system permease component